MDRRRSVASGVCSIPHLHAHLGGAQTCAASPGARWRRDPGPLDRAYDDPELDRPLPLKRKVLAIHPLGSKFWDSLRSVLAERVFEKTSNAYCMDPRPTTSGPFSVHIFDLFFGAIFSACE